MNRIEIPVWRTLTLKQLGWGFRSLNNDALCEKYGIRIRGPFGNFTEKGTVPSSGEISLALVSEDDLGISPSQPYSYRELLQRGAGFGLKPVHPGIGFQLYAAGLKEDFLFNGWIMSDPKHIPDSGTKGRLAPLIISRTVDGVHLTSEGLIEIDEPLYRDVHDHDRFFIFEC